MKPVKKIGIAGEGKMGTSIFLYLNGFDFSLVWLCSSEAESERAGKTFMKKTRLLFQSGVLSEKEYASKTENTRATHNIEDLKDCDLIIEAITEDLEAKRRLFESLDNTVNDECIFTTNSSSYLPSELFGCVRGRAMVAGLHFFFPVNLKKSVELITGSKSSAEIRETLNQFLLQINKKPFLQDETHAFILNRLLLDFQAEAFIILREAKLSIGQIDELVKKRFFPIGVFEFFDHVGIDVMHASIRSYTKNSINKEFYSPLLEKLEELLKSNHLGIKTRQGFYDYSRPNDLSSVQNLTDASEEYTKSVEERLWGYYIRSVEAVIDSGSCTREDLAMHVQDYMGMDSDPFVRSN